MDVTLILGHILRSKIRLFLGAPVVTEKHQLSVTPIGYLNITLILYFKISFGIYCTLHKSVKEENEVILDRLMARVWYNYSTTLARPRGQ
jgi:hypothetical protein